MYAGCSHFTGALARSLAATIVSVVPPIHTQQHQHIRMNTYFSGAAKVDNSYHIGAVAPGCYRTCMCLRWVFSLQQAEPFAC